jgi:NADH:ubiquinone oxidoreductase subunit C
MYGFFFFNKKDSRKLLLDYSKKEYPLLKDFPCEGYSDIYYNFFDFQINYIQNEVVEL